MSARGADRRATRAGTSGTPGMTSDEVKDAARMFWRLDQRQAERLQHFVAVSGTAPLEA